MWYYFHSCSLGRPLHRHSNLDQSNWFFIKACEGSYYFWRPYSLWLYYFQWKKEHCFFSWKAWKNYQAMNCCHWYWWKYMPRLGDQGCHSQNIWHSYWYWCKVWWMLVTEKKKQNCIEVISDGIKNTTSKPCWFQNGIKFGTDMDAVYLYFILKWISYINLPVDNYSKGFHKKNRTLSWCFPGDFPFKMCKNAPKACFPVG